jgi:hypothetical protein
MIMNINYSIGGVSQNIISGNNPNSKAKYKLKIVARKRYATRGQLSTRQAVFCIVIVPDNNCPVHPV